MFNLDLLQFDQTNILFLVLAGLGLIRERSLLPFAIVLVGCLIHGLLPALLVAGMILWHRVDQSSPRWVQLKDVCGLVFLFTAAVSPEPIQEFSIVMGLVMIGFSFGRGLLGVIPALLLLRQYQPHPVPLEVILGSAGLYWASAEIIRWSKTKQSDLWFAIMETLCVLGILFGLKDLLMKWTEEVPLVALGASIALIIAVLSSWLKWRGDGFFSFYQKSSEKLAFLFTFGNRFVSSEEPFAKEKALESTEALDGSFNRLFILTLVTLASLVLFLILNRGGVS